MKINKNKILMILLAFILLLPLSIKADEVDNATYGSEPLITTNEYSLTPSMMSEYSNKSYVIDKYDVNIVVNEDNTYDITETITAYFNETKHGIYRTIPLTNTIYRNDGSSSKNKAQVLNVSVDNKYTVSKEDGYYKIQIGDASKTLTGEQTYTIKYTYNIGKDPLEDADELYFNIIGSEWDTVIGNITFTITMPKDFDESKLGFSSGEVGSTSGSEKVVYEVKNNVITGKYNDVIKAGEALTVRCELEEGYFVNAGLKFDSSYIIYILPAVFVIISILIWFKYGRDDVVIETVEFYPPEGLNSLEVGFLYKGEATNKDVTSLLIYLANKGYIKISEYEKTSLFNKIKYFKITKLKEYDGNNIEEKLFLNGLFSPEATKSLLSCKDIKKMSVKSERKEVTSEDLIDKFYTVLDRIVFNINERKNKIFEKTSLNKSKYIVLMMIATFVIINLPIISQFEGKEKLILLFPAFGFLEIMIVLLAENDKTFSIIMIIHGLFFSGIGMIFILHNLVLDKLFILYYFIGILCIFCMAIPIKIIKKRTPYGTEMLGKISGFKNFLETAEKEELEAMVDKNPEYFYDILPYAYVLGVSNKWIEKFETISLKSPDWYDGISTFDITSFSEFINETMTSVNSVMSSSPSSDDGGSSGGSSGGGSSGGGSGGGGGGSW